VLGASLAAYVLTTLLAQGGGAATPPNAQRIVLDLPRAPAAEEAVWLNVRVGALARGARILVMSDDGTLLGAISPFAVVPGQEAGTYTIPLPESAVREGRVAVRLVVEGPRKATRPPMESEVENVGLVYVPVKREPVR
jgi:hypothetical protein